MLADLTESRAAATYAALAEIERLTALIPGAPSLADRMAVAELASQRHARYRDLLEQFEDGRDPQPAMNRAAPAVDEARRRVESADWWEALAAAALCAPLTDELFGALLADDSGDGGDDGEGDDVRDARTSDSDAASDTTSDDASDAEDMHDAAAQWATQRLRAAIDADPVLAARIAMWGRRLVGEAIVLCREFGGERFSELADRLAVNHLRRLTELGVAG